MKLGIISDTHGNRENLKKALASLKANSVEVIIHCGDLGSEELLGLFKHTRLIIVYGNMDKVTAGIQRRVHQMGKQSFAGPRFVGELVGKTILVTHGNDELEISEALSQRTYDYIFRGHTHVHADSIVNGTRVINPGALGGTKHEARSFAILEMDAGILQWVDLYGAD